jgi:hypothetical protein
MSIDTPRLDYAPAPTFLRRRWKRIVGAMALIMCVAGAFVFRGELRAGWARYSYLRLQRSCLDLSPAADRIVFDETPTAPALLLGTDYLGAWRTSSSDPATALWRPELFKEYWPTVRRLYPPPDKAALLFLHERTTPSGERRLVCVMAWLDVLLGTHQQFMTIGIYEIDPATWKNNPAQKNEVVRRIEGMFGPADPNRIDYAVPRKPLRIFAGQADAQDRSHFTIEYEVGGERKMLDGYLRDGTEPSDRLRLGAR